MPFVNHKPVTKQCLNPEHNPPTHMVLPPGEHTWQCPGCGEKQTFIVPEITL